MTAPLLWNPYFESSVLSGVQLESARNEASKLGRLLRVSAWGFWFCFFGPLPVGVVFFPSLPFMGVVLFPSFALGNAFGEGGTFLVPLSLFSILLSLHLLFSPSPSLSFSFLFFLLFSPSHSPFFLSFRTNSFHPFFLLLLFSISFTFPFSSLFFFLLLSLLLSFFFFLRELLVLFVSEI